MRKLLVLAVFALCLLPQVRGGATAVRPEPTAAGEHSGPKMILIIPEGPEGEKTSNPNLSSVGFERAKALARVIPADFVKPDFLFATKRSKHSNRPIETITPLAAVLHLSINEEFKDDDYPKLAQHILSGHKYDGKIVLICWHHGEIPNLAHALGAKTPDHWKGTVFDRVWEITYDKDSPIFVDLPEKALPGDSKN